MKSNNIKPVEIVQVNKLQCTCLRCEYKWFAKKQIPKNVKSIEEINLRDFLARQCPSCQNPYWDLPKKKLLKGDLING